MVILMKISSLSFDLDNSSLSSDKKIPYLSFLSYTIDPSSIVFGSWVSYTHFVDSLKLQTLKVFFSCSAFVVFFSKFLSDEILFIFIRILQVFFEREYKFMIDSINISFLKSFVAVAASNFRRFLF